jgi:hypothetical protein
MDQRQLNEGVRQAVRRCLDSNEPLAALQAFVGKLRHNGGWGETEISHVENAAKRILAILYEPDSAEDARVEERPRP